MLGIFLLVWGFFLLGRGSCGGVEGDFLFCLCVCFEVYNIIGFCPSVETCQNELQTIILLAQNKTWKDFNFQAEFIMKILKLKVRM